MKKTSDITQRLGFGMLITSVGGFMDAYSYTVRGEVFATGQTGNFVLVAVRFMERDYLGMFQALVPILSFWVGVFLTQELLRRNAAQEGHHWRKKVLLLELVILFVEGCLPHSVPNILANTAISLTAAMQYCCFRNFGEDGAYATIFCTGNMRSCAEMYYQGLILGNRKSLKKAFGYTGILLSFFLGACIGTGLSLLLGVRSIWLCCLVMLAALGCLAWQQKKES
jgi:uncharacterized membrane protein YoaK (UPF0700 family)